MNHSIFLSRPAPRSLAITDLIAYYWMELDVCEKLIAMGWEYSNNINLEKRIKELDEVIGNLKGRRQAVGLRAALILKGEEEDDGENN